MSNAASVEDYRKDEKKAKKNKTGPLGSLLDQSNFFCDYGQSR